MDAFFPTDFGDLFNLLIMAILIGFQIWMLVDAIRRHEWIWAVLIFFFSTIAALIYFILVYRDVLVGASRTAQNTSGNRRIHELQDQIQQLDKAHHHLELGDIYQSQGRLNEAEASYRAAYERDTEDLDIQAHLGRCLVEQKRYAEARPWLEQVCDQYSQHEYGFTLMALADCYEAMSDFEKARQTWEKVLESHSYDRARVRLAELYLGQGETEKGRALLEEVIADNTNLPHFAQERDQQWVNRAQKRLQELK